MTYKIFSSFVRISQVVSITGLSKTTIWRLEKSRNFPQRRQLSPNAVGYVLEEIMQWMKERPKVDPS